MAPIIVTAAAGGVLRDLTSSICDFFNFFTSATAASNFSLASATFSSHSYLISEASLAAFVAIISSSDTILYVSSA